MGSLCFIRSALLFLLPISTMSMVPAEKLLARTQATAAEMTSKDAIPDDPPQGPLAKNAPAFSAEKYKRTVRITPDGKQVILSENRPIKLARNAEGAIRVQGADPNSECNEATPPPHPKCPTEEINLFDPIAQTVTNWLEGEIAGHVSVVLQISQARAAEIEEDTTAMPDESGSIDTEGAKVTTQHLGQKTIEGLSATGLRTTVTLPARARGNQDTITNIHEVWTSTDMNLVVQVIDAQTIGRKPIKEETIHGLDQISTSPDPSLFHPPDDYEQQEFRVTHPGKSSDPFVERVMPQYAAWFVK